MKTTITIKPKQVTVNEKVVITCSSEGHPAPHFTIMHNGTNITTDNPYTIESVQKSDNGAYTCTAKNERGEDSATDNLTVKGENKL
jgi:hypothetical protein